MNNICLPFLKIVGIKSGKNYPPKDPGTSKMPEFTSSDIWSLRGEENLWNFKKLLNINVLSVLNILVSMWFKERYIRSENPNHFTPIPDLPAPSEWRENFVNVAKKKKPVQMEQSPFIQNCGCQMDCNVLWFFLHDCTWNTDINLIFCSSEFL